MAAVIEYNNFITNTLLINDLQQALIAQVLEDFDSYITLTNDELYEYQETLRNGCESES
jgi:hypothetical protein